MKTVSDLIDAARKALNVSSDAEFARQLGVSRGTIANWKSGYSLPDTVMCATFAGLTGLPLAQVLGIVGEARAVSREEKAVWRKLAATAMVLALGVGLASPRDAQAAVAGFDAAPSIHYAKWWMGVVTDSEAGPDLSYRCLMRGWMPPAERPARIAPGRYRPWYGCLGDSPVLLGVMLGQ